MTFYLKKVFSSISPYHLRQHPIQRVSKYLRFPCYVIGVLIAVLLGTSGCLLVISLLKIQELWAAQCTSQMLNEQGLHFPSHRHHGNELPVHWKKAAVLFPQENEIRQIGRILAKSVVPNLWHKILHFVVFTPW